MASTNRSLAAAVPAAAARNADQLESSLRALRAMPLPGTRTVPILTGISVNGDFTDLAANVIHKVGDLLAPADDPPRVFRYGGDVMFELREDGEDPALVPLRTGNTVERWASAYLSNVFLCEQPGRNGPVQYPVPPKALALLLADESLVARLARIGTYARRPVFSPDFVLLGPGYHPADRILVHGPAVEPDLTPLPAGERAIDRLPPHLRTLLGEVCFRSDADLANFVGLLLTGLLASLFVGGGRNKAMALVDGNQPGVGKGVLMELAGIILDGREPDFIPYTPQDDEIRKSICATLRSNPQSLVVIDNTKLANGAVVSSSTLESLTTTKEIAIRVLQTSTNFRRPNDVIWAITMNQTRVSKDLVSRGLPIRLAYPGDASERHFALADPHEYTRQHRVEILGELAGFIGRWNRAGRPNGDRTHRCHVWAGVIGGILAANGQPDFLSNAGEAAEEFDADVDQLGALAAAVLASPNGPHVAGAPAAGDPERARTAEGWIPLLTTAGLIDAVAGTAKTAHARGICIGQWLAERVGRKVTVDHGGRAGKAQLCVTTRRSRRKEYHFAYTWDSTPPAGADAVEVRANTPAAEGVAPAATPVPDAPDVPPAPPPAAPSPRPPAAGGNAEDWQ